MIHRAAVRLLPLICSGAFLLSWPTAQTHARTPTTETAVATAQAASSSTNAPHLVTPGPVDGQIANVTGRLLERYHYLRPHIDNSVSSKFLDRYLETLDPQHLHFLQS